MSELKDELEFKDEVPFIGSTGSTNVVKKAHHEKGGKKLTTNGN